MKHFIFLLLCLLTIQLRALEYVRTDDSQNFRAGNRKKVAEKSIFFPEFQFMYGLFQNYLHKWIDRPLFFDRDTRYPDGTFAYVTEKSFLKEAEIVKSYGFNGLGSLANIAGGSLYRDTDKFAVKVGKLPVAEVVQYGYDGNYKNLKTILEIASKSPFTAKINGKILVPTYNIFYSNVKNIKLLLDQARKDFPSGFYFMAQMDVRPADVKLYLRDGKVSDEIKIRYRQEIRDILSVFDGIQINPGINYTDDNGEYMCHFDTTFYLNVILPVLKEELAKPEFKDKLLGNTILHGYINHMSGVNHGEFGTARLRYSLEASMAGNPDYVLFFEWNEVNENTCFQPTLYNSLALQRLIRYAISQFNNESPSPNPGDDPTVPNLVFSCRETLKSGEPLQFELLNIPDGTTGNYTIQAIINDLDGKEIFRFPVESIAKDKFRTITYTIPTEQFKGQYIIRPALQIKNGNKEILVNNLHYVRIHPTVCNVYKSVRQPLRDLLTPEAISFKVTPDKNGKFAISAKLESPEELTSLEVLDMEREIAAADPKKEFDFQNNMIVFGSFSMQGGKFLPVSFKVRNSEKWQFRPWHAANVNFAYQFKRIEDTAQGNALIWSQPCNFTLSIPRSDIPQAVIEITVNGKNVEFKTADLAKLGKMAALVIPEERIRLDLENFEKLPDIPRQLNSKSAEISALRSSSAKFPVYQLRAVTKSGKIYRSAPIMPVRPSGKTTPVNLFSETAKKVVAVPLLTDLLPVLDYRFNPAAGAMIRSGSDERFDGQLGGGFVYCEPFCSGIPYPKGKTSSPVWKNENGFDYLHFNGENQYLNLPAESFPRGSFTLHLTLRPAKTSTPMVLFRHFDRWLGSVSAYLKYDRLYFAFGDRDLKTHTFATNLTVVPGKWNEVEITYDCKNITFTVNGKSRSFPLSARALYFKPFIFGGHDKIEFGIDRKMTYYHGDLKKLTIKHFTERISK